ncbi:MAG: CHASE domain-containing protein [Verrucomicrobiota bacterium]
MDHSTPSLPFVNPGPYVRARKGSLGAVMLVLLIGVSLTIFVATTFEKGERLERMDRIRQVAIDRLEVLKGQILRSMEVLNSIASLYAARTHVTREEFQKFVEMALRLQPELQALAWDPRVPFAERKQWEQRAKDEGFPSFQFTEIVNGEAVRAGDRAEYFPVYFLETIERNLPAFGYDVASEPQRRAALERARDSGLAAASAPIRLAQESESQRGFLVFHPLYSAPSQTLEERRMSLSGFAVAVFRIGDLVESSLRGTAEKGFAVSITDAAEAQPIYQIGTPAESASVFTSHIDVAGRQWTVRFQPARAFRSASAFPRSRVVFLAGLVISVLLSTGLWSYSRRAAIIEEQVRVATGELSAEIAERKRAEANLKSARDDLELRVQERTRELQVEVMTRKEAELAAESANRSKSQFLASVSHEIRTPMNAILGYSQILLREASLHPFQRDALATISSSSDHLLRLINDILDLSKIDAGRMEVEPIEFDLVDLAHEMERMFHQRCEEKRIGLRVVGLERIRTWPVYADERMLRQIIINLLGNAVKFTEQGRIVLRFDFIGSSDCKIEVRDTGMGIPEELHKSVFEPFYQGPNARTMGGTGLGLSISKRQVELMGGSIQMESVAGEGTAFLLEIPMPVVAASAGASKQPEVSRLAEGFHVRALIVDDIRENREVLSTILASIGCEVVLAENGRQAIEAVGASLPQIVFMDIRLPEIDGIEATRRIIREYGTRDIKVVAMSASAMEHEQELYFEAGCHHFLAKPFRLESVFSCLESLLGVRYVYREQKEGRSEDGQLDLGRIEVPELLLDRLVMAAELHSATVLKNCLRELEETGEECARLAEHLREFMASYDMETIQRIVAQLKPVGGHSKEIEK